MLKICRNIFFGLLLALLSLTAQAAQASPQDITNAADAVSNTAENFINPQNAALRDELLNMLQDDANKQQLQEYIAATRPVIDKYQSYFDTAVRASMWCEDNVPVIGQLLGAVIISTVNHFYEQELQELAQSDVSQKFAQLRNANLDMDVAIFQKAIDYYVENKKLDLQFAQNLQQDLNEKLETARLLKNVIDSSGVQFEIKDIGTLIPKLDALQ